MKKKEVYVLPIEQILGISRDIVMSFYEFALANEFNPIIRISCVSKSNCSIGRKLFIMSIIGHLSLQLATTLTQRVFAPVISVAGCKTSWTVATFFFQFFFQADIDDIALFQVCKRTNRDIKRRI